MCRFNAIAEVSLLPVPFKLNPSLISFCLVYRFLVASLPSHPILCKQPTAIPNSTTTQWRAAHKPVCKGMFLWHQSSPHLLGIIFIASATTFMFDGVTSMPGSLWMPGLERFYLAPDRALCRSRGVLLAARSLGPGITLQIDMTTTPQEEYPNAVGIWSLTRRMMTMRIHKPQSWSITTFKAGLHFRDLHGGCISEVATLEKRQWPVYSDLYKKDDTFDGCMIMFSNMKLRNASEVSSLPALEWLGETSQERYWPEPVVPALVLLVYSKFYDAPHDQRQTVWIIRESVHV
ncbi:hypothetical protein F5141DRAFT_1267723 [Pisolithus sp. B1]|nr:hypothetical protein F5141DRAFT_1267723 [Pisolithus sp. B1]